MIRSHTRSYVTVMQHAHTFRYCAEKIFPDRSMGKPGAAFKIYLSIAIFVDMVIEQNTFRIRFSSLSSLLGCITISAPAVRPRQGVDRPVPFTLKTLDDRQCKPPIGAYVRARSSGMETKALLVDTALWRGLHLWAGDGLQGQYFLGPPGARTQCGRCRPPLAGARARDPDRCRPGWSFPDLPGDNLCESIIS